MTPIGNIMNELSASGAFISTRSMKDVVCVFFFVCILPFSVSSSKISSSRREKDEEHDKELARRSRSEDANVFNAFSSSSAHEKHTTPRTSFVFLFFFVKNLSLVLLPLVVVVILEGEEEERDEEEEEREETESDDTVDAVAVIDIIIIIVVVVLFFLFSREPQTNSSFSSLCARRERERLLYVLFSV
jgi:Na+/H+ antiporter NhaD/arsenite permease-like protein